ncbi:MAG: ATP-dependent helicase [Anaerolineae bacterium]|nr:ATP-dependent helicase [Anaerolineae bacterium]
MSTPFHPTPQQQAVINHNHGPALVFAVAGAGKTTAMVHRIERLVREQLFPAEQILATSFARANVQDLRQAMKQWPHCGRVHLRTLHSLGYQIIRQAQDQGLVRGLRLGGDDDEEGSGGQSVLSKTLHEARRRNLPFKKELDGLDWQDFLAYVGFCKGNLHYAHLERANLPAAALKLASQAEPPPQLPWYLDLYRLYEEVRQQQGAITFDDMLLTAWELLLRFPPLAERLRQMYQCVLVDEFQDINLVQSELLDLLTPHRNYMAIGDDDQTIYEWRGANPRFILEFAQRYNAQTYLINDNFRCPAAPLILANQVIRFNQKRHPKQLSLTKGFHGQTHLHQVKEVAAMAEEIGRQIAAAYQQGLSYNDIAVLVRINAQTPYIEQNLINHNIPYRVQQPFYERPEIRTLIEYARLAWIEQMLQTGQNPLQKGASQEKFRTAWATVCNRPKRYISTALREEIAHMVISEGVSLCGCLHEIAEETEDEWQALPLHILADDLNWLAQNLPQDAAATLKKFDERIGYQGFLRDSSGFAQTGEGRAANVRALIDYAKGKGDLLAFMGHIRQLADERIGQEAHPNREAVSLATIHKSKGLEWPLVFVPQVNEAIYPFNGAAASNEEEERRLLYVALTRTKRDLHLYQLEKEPISPFLRQAQVQETLKQVEALRQAIHHPTLAWQASEALTVLRQSYEFQLGRYFQSWWREETARKAAIGQELERFIAAAQQQDALAHLGLSDAHLTVWRELGRGPNTPSAPAAGYPGLAELLAKPPPSAKPAQQKEKAEPEPETIRPGMWLHCDGGWGRIEAILDVVRRPQEAFQRDNTFIVLKVILRPQHDALPIEIDISAKRLTFPAGLILYTCGQCGRFTTPEQNLILKQHNRATHDGVGASFKRESGSGRKLTHLFFSGALPLNELV